MNSPYGNHSYSPPQNPAVYGDQNILLNLNQTMHQLNSIAAGQAATADLLLYVKQSFDKMQVYNDLIQVQKEQSVFNKEEAFSSIEETTQGLVMYGKTCKLHVILPVHLEAVIYVQMDSLYRQNSFYLLFFQHEEKPLIISSEEWNDPEFLLDALSSATGHQVRTYVSRKKTAQMLRNHLAARAQKFPVPFFAGWKNTASGWEFFLMDGSTHGSDNTYRSVIKNISNSPTVSQTTTASSTLTMLNQVIRFMSCITNTDLESILFIWIHAASLFSLLQGEGFQIPMGLCLYSSDPRIVSSLQTLMCWYHDKPISADLSPKEFVYQITARKDQPLTLVEPTKQNKNTDFLLSSMSSGQITSDCNHAPQKIQALPTIISNTLGPFCYSPLFILIEVTSCDLIPSSLAQFDRLLKYLPDYLIAFTSYTKDHITELITAVETEICSVHAKCPADYPISHEALYTLGILSGIHKFVWEFHQDLAPPIELLNKLRTLSPLNLPTMLTDAMCRSTGYADTNTAIVSRFCAIISSWIMDGQIDLRNFKDERINKPKLKNHGIIYLDSSSHYITRITFTEICKAADYSTPVVARALKEVGILIGRPSHDTTYQTRKTIKGRSLAFYRLDSTMVDEYSKIEG